MKNNQVLYSYVLNFTGRIRKKANSLPFLLFLVGICLTSFFYFFAEAKYESQLFAAISKNIRRQLPHQYSVKDFTLRAMDISHQFLLKRTPIFKETNIEGIKAGLFRPVTLDLITGDGACGSYAIVLARILKENNIPVRIGQMKVNGQYGGHIFVEAKIEHGWVVLDPFYNLAFKNEDGSLAGFHSINRLWRFYQIQTPGSYNNHYNYDGVRYTNWQKIPFISNVVKSSLDFLIGRTKADTISLRPYFMNIYHHLAWLSGIFLLLLLIQTRRVYKRKIQLQRIYIKQMLKSNTLYYPPASNRSNF
jgi:hypothetical protein